MAGKLERGLRLLDLAQQPVPETASVSRRPYSRTGTETAISVHRVCFPFSLFETSDSEHVAQCSN